MSLPESRPPIITLTTDFGLSDIYVGVMKGVMLAIAPHARLVDLTHDVAPQNVLEGSVRLEAAIDYFPEGTVHLVVVDPGVGSARAACVVQTARALFVGPDNGVLTLPLLRQAPRRVTCLDERARAYCRQPMSATFHGRDLFAPIAAHLANGLPLDALGDAREVAGLDETGLALLSPPEPLAGRDEAGRPLLRLHVLYADRFGNLITDLTPPRWADWRGAVDRPESSVTVRAGRREWRGIVSTFAGVAVGDPLAYWGSGGRLEIGVRNGSAARELNLGAGDPVDIV